MRKAGFIVHPVSNSWWYAWGKLGARSWPAYLLPPPVSYHLVMPRVPVRRLKMNKRPATGIKSLTGVEIDFVSWAVPFSPEQMIKRQPVEEVIEAGHYLCVEEGAEIIGLGAFTSIIGNHGQEVADALEVGVTTGNSLTAATGAEGLLLAAQKMDYQPAGCAVAVIGASGSIGGVAAQLLAPEVGFVYLVGKDPSDPRLHGLGEIIGKDKSKAAGLEEALKPSNLVITVTSAVTELKIDHRLFLPGTVVCDIARPRDIGRRLARKRRDILVFEGAILQVPGVDVDLGWDFGFPPGMTYACMAETMTLAMQGITTDYSLGELELWRVKQIAEWAKMHGFTQAGFRSFDRALPDVAFEQVRERAARSRCRLSRGR